ncbi:MAG: hypothetical protein AAF667_10405 [Pseudomonadota bacterium]
MSGANNLRQASAQGVFEDLKDITEDMESRPNGEEGALEFIDRLSSGPTPEEAVTFAAYMLIPRYAVWWGHECLRSQPELLDTQDDRMLGMAADWAGAQDEATRWAVLSAAMDVSVKSPGVWIALAAGWSGGSLAAPDYDPVPPPPFLTSRAVNAGVLTLLARAAPEDRPQRISEFASMAKVLATAE